MNAPRKMSAALKQSIEQEAKRIEDGKKNDTK